MVPGLPLNAKLRRAISATGSPRSLLYVTDAAPLKRKGVILYLQDTRDGSLTGAFLLGEHALRPGDADALADALRSPQVEVVRLDDPQGAWVEDEALAADLEQLLEPDDPEGPGGPAGFYLGLALGSGAGLATEVTDPGLAPVPLLLRADLALRLDPTLELGLAARVQPIKRAALAEPYVRWRMGWVRLRLGAMLGQITHHIVRTENRDASTSEWIGPTVGAELPLGWFLIGVHALAPLYPSDPTVHLDATVGVGFDL
jgi:hypothetical protein